MLTYDVHLLYTGIFYDAHKGCARDIISLIDDHDVSSPSDRDHARDQSAAK